MYLAKVTPFVVLALLLGVVAVLFVPSPRGYPWSFRFQPVSFLPGVEAIVKWDARRTAVRDLQAGRYVLFGFGENGGDLGIDGCDVTYFRQYRPSRTDLPRWVHHGLGGQATVMCHGETVRNGTHFTLVEAGCIPTDVLWTFGTEYNRTALGLGENMESRTSNGALHLTVTPLACARVAPAGERQR